MNRRVVSCYGKGRRKGDIIYLAHEMHKLLFKISGLKRTSEQLLESPFHFRPCVEFFLTGLWQVIGDDQLRLTAGGASAGVELIVICDVILVGGQGEAQTELGPTRFVDEFEVGCSGKIGSKPVVWHGGEMFLIGAWAGRGRKVGEFQADAVSEIPAVNVDQQVAEGRERIGSHRGALVADYQLCGSDDRIIGDGFGVEGEDATVLSIAGIVA